MRLPQGYFDKRPVGELQTRLAELGNIRGFLTGSLLTLALDSVFSVIYIAVMVVYSGVLTAVTLGSCASVSWRLHFWLRQLLNRNFVKQLRKMLQLRVFWLRL